MADVGALANQYAGLIYDPQKAAIDRRLQLSTDRTNIANQAVQTQGQLGRQYVGDAYNVLDAALQGNKTQAMQALDTAGNQIGQGYRDANAISGQLRDQSTARLSELARSLNAGNYAMPILGGIEQTANDLIAANAQRDATVTGNLRNWAAQSGDVYNRQIGTGHQMRADALSRLENDLLRYVSENNLAGAEEASDLNDELVKMLGERGGYLAQMIQQLGEQEWQRSVQQAQLDMEAQKINAQLSESAADRALRSRGMDMEQARFDKSNEMTDKEKLQLQMQAWGMQNEQNNADRGYGLDLQRLLAGQEMDPGTKLQLATYMSTPGANIEVLYQLGLLDRPEARPPTQVGGVQAGGSGNKLGQAAQRRALQSTYNSQFPASRTPARTVGGALPYTVFPSAGGMRFGTGR